MEDIEEKAGSWLTLAEATKRMGVSAGTLRAWADQGRVRAYRTPGGHRRFQIQADETLPQEGMPHAAARWRLLEHSALGRLRLEMEDAAPELLPPAMPAALRAEYRALGLKLVQLLARALQQESGALAGRATALGKLYGELHVRARVSPQQALATLGLFRAAFITSVVEFAFGLSEPAPEQLAAWLARANETIDRVCLAMLEFEPGEKQDARK